MLLLPACLLGFSFKVVNQSSVTCDDPLQKIVSFLSKTSQMAEQVFKYMHLCSPKGCEGYKYMRLCSPKGCEGYKYMHLRSAKETEGYNAPQNRQNQC
jgi:hypothetical protein